ncbi:two-component system, chemotaxis family, sensor kinase CheA [Fictibacillus enclensis]|uniref:Chemotaxis protein CheA n=1 Tax=Fictibacillus enclensis TaxID=1017270 RepID=A0A0V8JEJ2_9BACL|nr:chemotaxis protein CheA [Fictibacillus enclensis]KSU85088.1 chemotaxis protein CheA [Fictibacillus enclensis]SCB90724.1 two-component system, chemotaxis family, sensor kinase CheA [Fictibacillus enclensis]
MDTSEYLDIFIEESKEHLQSINEHVLLLEKQPEELATIQEIFRSAHTLKGMSASMGYGDLANLTHAMENVLDGIRNGKLHVTQKLLDSLFVSLDHLEEMVMSIAAGGDGKKDTKELIRLLNGILGEDTQDKAQTDTSNEDLRSYDEFERSAIHQSLEQGFLVYRIEVELHKECLLKAVRAFMVFNALENLGDIIKSEPSADLIEQEQFNQSFFVTLITQQEAATIESELLSISEIEKVALTPLQPVGSEQKEAVAEQVDDQKGTTTGPKKNSPPKSAKTIRVSIERLDLLMSLFEELVIDRGRLERISSEMKDAALQETVERVSRVSSDLQELILNMRMVPIDQVFNRFPRMVRGLAKDLHKKVELQVEGAETELDRLVADEIGDPLVHLLRNSLDHGIEDPEQRIRSRKSEKGTITLKAYHSGNRVFIEIQDDGAGIDADKVLNRAVQKGIISENSARTLTGRHVYELLFAPGFSTAEVISDISGRGVGLDAVKNKIESLGGSVSVDSTAGQGSTFTIQLPLNLSIIPSLLVEAGTETYAVPLPSIIETALVDPQDIIMVHKQPMMDFRGKVIPLVSLKDWLEVPQEAKKGETNRAVVIVKKENKLAGLIVDGLIGQQEIVLKPLGSYLDVPFVSGAAILGDGQVALIIDCNSLFI